MGDWDWARAGPNEPPTRIDRARVARAVTRASRGFEADGERELLGRIDEEGIERRAGSGTGGFDGDFGADLGVDL